MNKIVNRPWVTRLLAVVTLLLLLVLTSNYVWSRLGKPMGDQTVNFSPADKKCGQVNTLKYCVYAASTGSNTSEVIYHLHGRNLDEAIWNDQTYYTSMIQSEWQRLKQKPPLVVSVSYGGSWLLAPKGERESSGLLEIFMADLSAIESKIGVPAKRSLLGESMGGLNVLIAGLNYPDRFAKVAALCPGVYVESPFASWSTIKRGAERTGASPKIVFGIMQLAKQYFANEQEWQRASPVHAARRSSTPLPQIYLSCGLYDHYGNFEGTQALASLATEKGARVDWHPLYGGHCATDVNSLAAFLIR